MMGVMAGLRNVDGSNNTFLGAGCARGFYSGDDNTFVGYYAGNGAWSSGNGNRNTILGSMAGYSLSDGDGNVFIGNKAGYGEDPSNKLIIENNYTGTDNENNALIYGDFSANQLRFNANVSINYDTRSQWALTVSEDDDDTYGLVVYGTTYCTDGSWAGSDIRLKKNISTFQNALEKVMMMRGVNYEWRKDEFKEKHFTDKPQIGFIAQEVEKVIPQIVTEGPEGYKAIDYSKMTVVLLEAIKEQQKQIEALKREVEVLKAQNR
jgi:hypothetical protein